MRWLFKPGWRTSLPEAHRIRRGRGICARLLRLLGAAAQVFICVGLALLASALLFGCGDRAEPRAEMPVVQITDNRVITINSTSVAGEGNTAKVVARPEAEIKPALSASPEARQEASQTTKSGAWIVWLAIIGLILAAGGYVYWRRRG